MRIVKSIFTKRRTQELQRLVDRYLEGGTTLDEERQVNPWMREALKA